MNEDEAFAYHRKTFKVHIFYVYNIEHYDAIINIANAFGAHLIINRSVRNQLLARKEREQVDRVVLDKASKSRASYAGQYKIRSHVKIRRLR